MPIFNKKLISFLLIITPIFWGLVSCSKNPLTNPYAYAPLSSNALWQPSKKEQNHIANVSPFAELEIPDSEACISLGDLFEVALYNSPKTRHSWEEARERAAGYASSLSSYFPSLSFQGNYSAMRQGSVFNGTYVVEDVQQWGPELQLSFLLWDFGERRYQTEQAFQMLQQSNWSHNEEIQSVMQSVASAYYTFLYAKALLSAYEADFLNAEETYNAAKEKNLSGIFDETDMLQAKTNFLKKKVAVTSQSTVVKNHFVDLLSVLGIPADAHFHLGSFPEKEPIDPFSGDEKELIGLAYKMRPELLASKAEILAAEANVKKNRAELLPKIQFTGTGGEQWYDSGHEDQGNYHFQLDLTFPIFTGFYYLNQIKRAEADLEKTISLYRETELRVLKQIKQAHNDYTMAKQELCDAKSYLEAAQIEFKAMFERYKLGIVDILDLLSSQSFLSDARAQYAKAKKLYYMAIINTAFATGTLTNLGPSTTETNQ